MMYPSALSIFDPGEKELSQIKFNRALRPEEKILWIGTPSHIRLWFWILGDIAIVLFLIVFFFSALDGGSPSLVHPITVQGVLDLIWSHVLFALQNNKTIFAWPLTAILFGVLSYPGYSLAKQLAYVVTNQRACIIVGSRGIVRGSPIFSINSRRQNKFAKNLLASGYSDGHIDIEYVDLIALSVSTGRRFKSIYFYLFDSASEASGSRIYGHVTDELLGKIIWPSRFARDTAMNERLDSFAGRFRCIRDAERVATIVAANIENIRQGKQLKISK